MSMRALSLEPSVTIEVTTLLSQISLEPSVRIEVTTFPISSGRYCNSKTILLPKSNIFRAISENRTHDLFPTKEALYP